MPPVLIPQKSSFKLAEVTELTSVKPYVLRYWETQFDGLVPVASSSGQKIYDREQVEVISKIQFHLQIEKKSIDEVRALIRGETIVIKKSAVDYSRPQALCLEVLIKIEAIRSQYNWKH